MEITGPRRTADLIQAAFAGRPAAVRDVLLVGVTRGELRSALRARTVVRLRHGVVLPATVWQRPRAPLQQHALECQALAAHLAVRRSEVAPYAFAGRSAAALHDLPYPGLATPVRWPPTLVAPEWSGPPHTDWIRRRARLPHDHVALVAGVPTTSLARTAVDVAIACPFVDALAVADAVLRRLVLLRDEIPVGEPVCERSWLGGRPSADGARRSLVRTLEEAGHVRRTTAARRVIALADPGAENGFESASRAVLLEAGLPRPHAGLAVVGDDGRTYYADLCWPQFHVIGEADGRGKYASPEVLYAEKLRQEALERAGWIVVRWTWEDLFRVRPLVVARVQRALEAGVLRSA